MRSAAEAIVLLPLNVPALLPERLEGDASEVWEDLRLYLESHETSLKTLAFSTARRLWLESIREARAVKANAGFDEAARIFVAKLSDHADFGTVMFASLSVQSASVKERNARWDGAEQTVEIDEGDWAGFVDEETPFAGTLPAASLQVVVLDASGEVVHHGRSGLALLARVRLAGRPELGVPRFEIVDRAEPFADREPVLLGISRALTPFLTPLEPRVVLPRDSQARDPSPP